MKFIGVLVLCACALLLSQSPQTVGWRGIVPLHSTRADVERILGKPNFKHELYDFDAERVGISYSNDPCAGVMKRSYADPGDTVMSIDISPKKKLLLSDIELDLRNYKKTTDSTNNVRSFYRNDQAGITIGTFERGGDANAEILIIHYGPTAKDTQLRCPAESMQQVNKTASSGIKRDESRGPVSDPCPTIIIKKPSADDCSPQLDCFYAAVAGVDPRYKPTYTWSVSGGVIIRGQYTSMIAVERTTDRSEQLCVTLEVGGIIPPGCPHSMNYTSKSHK